MKTSTAFAILALLAAGSGAVPISPRQDGDCPCEVLDPNNTVDKVHSVHQDQPAFVSNSPNDGRTGGLTNSHADKPVTLHIPQGSSLDDATGKDEFGAESTSPNDEPNDDSDTFESESAPAFRASRRPRPVEDMDIGDDMGAADINSAEAEDESADPILSGENKDTAEDIGNQVEEQVGEQAKDEAKEEVQALGLAAPANTSSSGDQVEDQVNSVINPSPPNDKTGSDPVIQAADAVDDKVAEQTGDNAENHVGNLTASPVDHTGDTVSPITQSKVQSTSDAPLSSASEVLVPGSGPIVNDTAHNTASPAADKVIPGTGSRVNVAADGPTSNAVNGVVPASGLAVQNAAGRINDETARPIGQSLPGNFLASGMPDVDVNMSVRPGQGQSAAAQSSEPRPQSGSAIPVSANALRPLAGGLTGPLADQLQNGQLGNSVRPAGASMLGGLPNRPLAGAPLGSTGGLANIVSGGNGLPILNSVGQPQANTLRTGGANGLPIVNTLAQPQGSTLNTNTVQGLPIISLLNSPQDDPFSDDFNTESVEEASPETFQGGRTKSLATKVRPTTENAEEDAQDAPEALNDGPDGAVDEVTADLAKEDVEACRDCIDKAAEPASSRVSDGSEVVQSDPLNIEPAAEPATSRVASTGNVVQSDPLNVQPAVESPESESPISYQCATAPVSKMPVNTTPCLTNWGGRVGEEVDMCITQEQLAARPGYTMACPEEMQDNLGDDLNLLSRDDNNEEWDMLSRDIVQQYVRLCMVVNGL